jgi:hypothetical protein
MSSEGNEIRECLLPWLPFIGVEANFRYIWEEY